MKISVLLTAGAIALCAAQISQSKNLYVDGAAGDDSVSYAANASDRPWRSLGRATWGSTNRSSPVSAEAARAGDVVIVAAGIYETNAGTGVRMNPIYNPVNSGTSGNPIVFRAATPGAVELRASNSPTGQPIIGVMDRSHIVWDGFSINEQYVPTTADTGPVVVWSATNVVLQNLTIRGFNRGWVDNHNGIRLENTNTIQVRNNSISGYRESQQAYNSSGLTMYRSTNVTIENNDFFEANSGIYMKGYNTTGIVVRNNKFTSVGNGVQLGGVEEVKIYRNIFDQCWEGCITISIYNDGNGVNNATIANNTLMRSSGTDFGALTYRGGGVYFTSVRVINNIFGRSRAGASVWASSLVPAATSRNNVFYSNDTVASVAWTRIPLSIWQATHQQDLVGSREANPAYVNETGADYHLSGTSPLLNSGIDVLDLDGDGSTTDSVHIGAYATGNEVIGRSVAVVAAPNPPGDVRVQ